MSRKPPLPKPDPRPAWMIEQGARCGCRGADDLCCCQNEIAPWRYGLAPTPRPPTPMTRSPTRDVHQVIYTFRTADAARAFREKAEQITLPEILKDPPPPQNPRKEDEG